ncbi:MAG: mechanosensitive ion channel family protein [Planctomycetota bacterium]
MSETQAVPPTVETADPVMSAPEAAGSYLAIWWEQTQAALTTDLLISTILFLVILLVSWIIARVVAATVRRGVERSRRQPSALFKHFVVTWSRRAVIILGVVVALETIGIATAPIIAGLGVAGFIIGFAVQDTLNSFTSGLMLLIYRPFDVDDYVEVAGTAGIVTELSIANTVLRTPDNKVVIVPNGKVWGETITNFTRNPTRRMDLVLSVSYSADLDRVQQLVRDHITGAEGILEDPKPTVEVLAMGESSIDFAVRPWVKTSEYWDVFWRMQKGLKQLMDANDIEIPFPQRTVWMRQDAQQA